MIGTHTDDDASVDCWSNKGLEVGALSGKVTFAFKTANIIQSKKKKI